MFRHVPNALTAARLVLAGVFFAMLSYYQYAPREHPFTLEQPFVLRGHFNPLWLNIAFLVYLVALFTDFLDGYLARRWKVEGAFGRVVDPFVDKVLVLGSFIFFAGKNFTTPFFNPGETPNNVLTITGVVPWMVVVILARELLVTSLRGVAESAGQNFGAAFSGKLKMVFQSVTILVILIYVNYEPWLSDHGYKGVAQWAKYVRDAFIWLTILITVASGLLYVQRAVSLYRGKPVKV